MFGGDIAEESGGAHLRTQVRRGWRLPSDSLRLSVTPSAAGRVHQASGYSVSDYRALGLPGSLQHRKGWILPPLRAIV